MGIEKDLSPGFHKASHCLLPKFALLPIFKMNFGGKLPIFSYIFLISAMFNPFCGKYCKVTELF